MLKFPHIPLLLISALLLSCSPKETPIPPPATGVNHVLLVYLGGDNSLSEETEEKLTALRNSWNGDPATKIVIYIDNRACLPHLVEIVQDKNGTNTIEVIETYTEESSASPEVFARVIRDVQTRYPVPDYGLLLFSHATGWLPAGALKDPGMSSTASIVRSVVEDHDEEMALADFAAAIPDGMFDYIVFEACFMAGIEVAYELRAKATYLFASSAEIFSPGFTPLYGSAIPFLFNGNMKSFGERVFYGIITYSGSQRSATYSLINTSGVEALAAFVAEHVDFTREVDMDDIQRFDREEDYHLFFDFTDYYSRLLDTDEEKAELDRLIEACVTWDAATPNFLTDSPLASGFEIHTHSGLTSYIPHDEFPLLNAAYRKTAWAARTNP